ncbi:hypothetical protein GQ53DRAFT_28728 [Thozetella sp. PMI_491]|nr:hypothetical protein GQ53DRAFT_28728 [Thozetella sp. PMI_491]
MPGMRLIWKFMYRRDKPGLGVNAFISSSQAGLTPPNPLRGNRSDRPPGRQFAKPPSMTPLRFLREVRDGGPRSWGTRKNRFVGHGERHSRATDITGRLVVEIIRQISDSGRETHDDEPGPAPIPDLTVLEALPEHKALLQSWRQHRTFDVERFPGALKPPEGCVRRLATRLSQDVRRG